MTVKMTKAEQNDFVRLLNRCVTAAIRASDAAQKNRDDAAEKWDDIYHDSRADLLKMLGVTEK